MAKTDQTSRDMVRGNLDMLVLSVLMDEPAYGYLIQQRLREATAEMVDVQAGTLYPLLHRLEVEKLVRSKWDDSTGRKRKWYGLTAAGRRKLTHQARQWSEYAECLMRVLVPVLDGKPKLSEGTA